MKSQRTKKAAETKKSKKNWEACELDFRTTTASLDQLGIKYGMNKSSISRHMAERGITRDLVGQVQQATNEALIEHAATEFAAKAQQAGINITDNVQVSTDAIIPALTAAKAVLAGQADDAVSAAAATNVAIILGHRRDIARGRDAVKMMIDEVTVGSATREHLESLAELAAERAVKDMPDGEDKFKQYNKLLDAFLKLVSLSSRAAVIQRLSDALSKLVALERQAYGIDAAEKNPTKPTVNVSISTEYDE